jgi:tetratricopeptide (TPR) repeat protein
LRSAGRFEEALDWSQRTQTRFDREVTGTTALFNQAKIHLNLGNYAAALDSFTKLRSRNLSQRAPGATNRSEVEFMRVYCLEKLGRIQEAIDGYLSFPVNRNSYYGNRANERLKELSRDPKAKSAVSAKFKVYAESAKRELANGNFETAKSSANQALRLTADPNAEVELIDILRRSYNNLSAYNRYSNFNLKPVGREMIVDRSLASQERSHRTLADELLFLGLYDEGAPELSAALGAGLIGDATDEEESAESELEAAKEEEIKGTEDEIVDIAQRRKRRASTGLSGEWQYSMAVYLNRGSHAHPAIRYGESTFSSVPEDFRLELLPRDIAELLYPAPYQDDLIARGRDSGVDARFMLAIARQESRFNTSAKSPSAARGMFQFIASTADRIRQDLKLESFNQDDLYSPPTAISFASQYMRNLFGEFKDNPYAVAASYNGGEQAVRRWIDRARSSEPDRFVIEVSYQESKDYVYKVMNNYWAYQQLYQDNLLPR